jgi:hypothetical protein
MSEGMGGSGSDNGGNNLPGPAPEGPAITGNDFGDPNPAPTDGPPGPNGEPGSEDNAGGANG